MQKIISIQEQCYRLRELLICHGSSTFILTSEWLLLASAVENIEVSINKYDTWAFKCNPSYEYDEANEQLLNKFLKELSIFNFIWCALEAIINEIIPKNYSKKFGKVRSLVSYINKNIDQSSLMDDYIKSLIIFNNLSKDFLDNEKLTQKVKSFSEGVAGLGLMLVYDLRNTFAHGSLELPYPDENNEPYSTKLDLVRTASRICLYSFQFILYIYLKNQNDFEIFHKSELITNLTSSEYVFLLHTEFEAEDLYLTLFDD